MVLPLFFGLYSGVSFQVLRQPQRARVEALGFAHEVSIFPGRGAFGVIFFGVFSSAFRNTFCLSRVFAISRGSVFIGIVSITVGVGASDLMDAFIGFDLENYVVYYGGPSVYQFVFVSF